MAKYPLPLGKDSIPDDILLPASLHMEFLDKDSVVSSETHSAHALVPGEFDMTIEQNIRVTATDHFQDVRHVVLRTHSSELS